MSKGQIGGPSGLESFEIIRFYCQQSSMSLKLSYFENVMAQKSPDSRVLRPPKLIGNILGHQIWTYSQPLNLDLLIYSQPLNLGLLIHSLLCLLLFYFHQNLKMVSRLYTSNKHLHFCLIVKKIQWIGEL